MMKKTYIKPESDLILFNSFQLLAGSGPNANDQENPGLGGGGAREFFDFDEFENDPL